MSFVEFGAAASVHGYLRTGMMGVVLLTRHQLAGRLT